MARCLCRRFKNGSWREFKDLVSPEVRITMHWPKRETMHLWAFPEALRDLALGHVLMECCRPGLRPVLTRSGEDSFFFVPGPDTRRGVEELPPSMSPDHVLRAMEDFMTLEGKWEATGCFHRAGIWDGSRGRLVHSAEDIGRHNCLDRLAAWSLHTERHLSGFVLLLSARLTASLAMKACKAGFKAVISRSATTTAALSLVQREKMALAAFARQGRFSIFHDPLGLFAHS
jgi:FdhD protein